MDDGHVVVEQSPALAGAVHERRAGGSPLAAGLLAPGDVHPTAAGRRLLAATVEKAVGL